MDTAIIELNALADAIGPTPQHNDLFPVGGCGLAFLLVGGVKVRRGRGKFRSARIDALVNGAYPQLVAYRANFRLTAVQQLRQPGIGETFALQGKQFVGTQCRQGAFCQGLFFQHQLFNLGQKPRINTAVSEHVFQ